MKVVVAISVVAVALGSAGVAFAKPLTETEWKKQGNAICKRVNKDLDKIGSEVFAGLGRTEQPSDAQLQSFAGQAVPVIEAAINDIDGLQEPKSLKKDVKKFKSEVAKAIVALDSDPSVLLANEDPFKDANKVARRLGLKACANSD